MPRWLALFGLLVLPAFANAAAPTDPADKAALIGQPTELIASTSSFTLNGPRDVRQLVVTGKYASGDLRDLTSVVEASSDQKWLIVGEGLFLRATANGTATLTLKAGNKTTQVKVTAIKQDVASPVSFRHDVIAAFNVGGCNMGACHGTPSGKNGFKLSLRGFDPTADFNQLTREQFGRRSDKHNPEASLILLKGLGRVPHEGGARLGGSSYPTEMIQAWLAEGLQDDASTLPSVKKLEVAPGARVFQAPAKWQQVSVVAHYSDGKARDVTRLTNFSSSDPAIAEVNLNGFVEFKRPGEVAILVRYLEEMVSVRLTYLEPQANFKWSNPPEANFVDKHVFAKLKQMTILPSELSVDSDFVRRAYLDGIGRMPTPEEAKAFAANKSPNKRNELIDQLVMMPEFADFWALKWSDVFRSSRKTIQQKGSYGFQMWLRDRLAVGTGIDKIVQELITANGNTYSNPPANYYRIAKDPQSLAESTAQLFLGVRMQCAKCHNHPFERWTQDDYYGFAAWFARVRQKPEPSLGPKAPNNQPGAEVVYVSRSGDVSQPRTGKVMKPRKLGEGDADVPSDADRRAYLAEWLTKPSNPFFAKSVANRVWFHVMGKGIVDPVDDFRESNPSCNDELLDALAIDFSKNGFDLRHLVKTIMKSRTYQLSAQPNDSNAEDTKYFSHAVTKLLTAEQLLDAICDVTGVPEKFAGLPAGTRATQLPDGEVNHPFLKTFGQPARELACECERESDGNLAQALQLINGPTVNEKVRSTANRLTTLMNAKKTDQQILEELYFTALARGPEAEEVKVALGHVAKASDKRKAWEDVLWAIINTREFLFRH